MKSRQSRLCPRSAQHLKNSSQRSKFSVADFRSVGDALQNTATVET
jgi:hypothetical protein